VRIFLGFLFVEKRRGERKHLLRLDFINIEEKIVVVIVVVVESKCFEGVLYYQNFYLKIKD
jgi:hypothetical protein